ncbi:MAG: tRNA preQ1(34) S-adenosylmethionine ribosyltransferase-isomerase QueA [Hyphomicrobiales bacterium]
MRVDDFDFDLPEDRIALRPARPRDSARLLAVQPDAMPRFSDRTIADLPSLLSPGDALVFNDTRVIRAALEGVRHRETGSAQISLNLIERVDGCRWKALARPAKRLAVGDRITFGHEGRVCLLGTLAGRVEAKGEAGEITIAFDFHGPTLDEAIASLGSMPLPPYIASRREPDDEDVSDYQTVYAAREGAVAAPTAGLHFTPALFEALEARGIARHFVTLHVGAGTFLPVRGEDTGSHSMHSEYGEVPEETAGALNAARARGGRIVAVGTTALRLLETAAAEDGRIMPFAAPTDLFILPGYRFKAVDRLITNFHLPRSTLFMLVCAFSGTQAMKDAYAHAVAAGYRFYSYGDACLLDRGGDG